MRTSGQEGGGGGGDQIQKSEKDQVRRLSLKKKKQTNKIHFLVYHYYLSRIRQMRNDSSKITIKNR